MAECIPEQAPFTEEAYEDLSSRYPFVVMKPGDDHLYGFRDFHDAEDFLLLEAAWKAGSIKPIRVMYVRRV